MTKRKIIWTAEEISVADYTSVALKQFLDADEVKKIIENIIKKHTIKNSDGEYYLAVTPELLLEELLKKLGLK